MNSDNFAPRILGLDIGGVLRHPVAHKKGIGSLDRHGNSYMGSPAFRHARQELRKLCENNKFNTMYIISRLQKPLERKMLRWLSRKGFVEFIPADRIHFCRERAEKAPIAQRLGVTHFVDDRPEVVSHMIGIVPHLFLLRPKTDELLAHMLNRKQVRVAQSWPELIKMLCV